MSLSAISTNILEALNNPSIYPTKTNSVELLQTHISWLFLTDTHVYKIKKPVNFGFLNFSTLELRRYYCNEEIRLNRRLCPDMYERVIELRQTDTGISFIDDGVVIEYAVMMKRLPSDRMLDKLVDSDNISVDDITKIAHRIYRFHAEAPTSPQIAEFGSINLILDNWQENFDQTIQFNNSTLPSKVHKAIHSYVEQFTYSNNALFQNRIRNGYIRECDGDIHLENICLVNSAVYIFDCIEFNDRFRFSDTAADVAFLLMDLDFHNRPDLAVAALTSYVAISVDIDLIKLIDFYKIYRAFVRGKIESYKLLDQGISAVERSEAKKRAIRYFRLAQGYCLREHLTRTLFITCGTMGSGKSTLANQLAFELGLNTFNSDVIRKQLVGIAPETHVKAEFNKGLYSKEMSKKTYCHLEYLADTELAAGHSVIIDAGFGNKANRSVFAKLAAKYQAEFVILYSQCNHDVQLKRLIERATCDSSVSDGRIELLDLQVALFEQPHEKEGTIITCCSDESTESSLDQLYERVLS